MRFAHDTVASLGFMTDLVNSGAMRSASGADELATIDQLVVLLDRHGYSGRRDRDQLELAQIRGVRDEFLAFWSLERDASAELVNRLMRESNALPQLVRHDDWDWHLHGTPDDAPLLDRMRAEAGMAMFDIIRADETDRLRVCSADDCNAVLIDLSKNRSKRYCDVGNCGNRMNVLAYRARRAAEQ